jgi:hypothetical protein
LPGPVHDPRPARQFGIDAVVDAEIGLLLSGLRMPRMNAIMERWIQTCRRELLDRTLIHEYQHAP